MEDISRERIDVPMKVSDLEDLEREAVMSSRVEAHKRDNIQMDTPIFLEIDKFKAIIDEITMSKRLLKESEDALLELNELKGIKDRQFDKWRRQVEELQRRFIFVDKMLFEKNIKG